MRQRDNQRRALRRVAAMTALSVLAVTGSGTAIARVAKPVQCPKVVTDEVKITPADGNLGGFFSEWADLDGNFAVAAAPGDDDNGVPNSGAVYVYQKQPDGSWVQDAKLVLSPPELGDFFGESVAISGDTLVVGAPGTDAGPLHFDGAVYVYRRVSGVWTQEATLSRIDPGPQLGSIGDQFGFAVAIDGDRIAVGSTQDDDLAFDSGAAYVFDRVGTTWTQVTKLTASDGVGVDSRFFGNDIAVDGDSVAVGVGIDSSLGLGAGSAYVYDFDGANWVETKLFAADAAAYDFFGKNVDLDGSRMIVGAHGDDDIAGGSQLLNKGSAYVFENVGGVWMETAKLQDANGGNQDYYGTRVAIDRGRIVTGNVDLTTAVGQAYVYMRRPNGTWMLIDKVVPSDVTPGDPGAFGVSVASSGKHILVGANAEDGAAINAGAVYIYTIRRQCPGVVITLP